MVSKDQREDLEELLETLEELGWEVVDYDVRDGGGIRTADGETLNAVTEVNASFRKQ